MYKIEKSYLSGTVKIPSSKSHTIRALLCAALSNNKTTLCGHFEGNDIQEMVNALTELGIKIAYTKRKIKINSTKGITNLNPHFNIKESATTFRMLLAIVAMNCQRYSFTLGSQLASRPHSDIVDFLNSNGAEITFEDSVCCGKQIEKITNNHYNFGISSQGFSGILIAFTFKGVHLGDINGEIVSKQYIEMTKDVLTEFGLKSNGGYEFEGKPLAKHKYIVPSDYSTLANYVAMNAVGNKIKYKCVEGNHPDKVFVENIFKQREELDIEESIDSICPAIYMAINSNSVTHIKGISRAQYKESNRVEEIKGILEKLNMKYEVDDDSITIYPNNQWKENPTSFTSSNDHRCDMIKVMISSQAGGEIDRVESINKSHTSFIKNLIKLGCKIEEI